MKREILFRGKRINDRWVYGSLVVSKNIDPAIYYEVGKGLVNQFDWCYVKNGTIGQYTGLKDKNGKKIFEGDILRFQVPDGTIRHFVIEWADEDRILRPLSDFVPDGNPIRISGWCFNWNGYRLYPTVIDGVPDNEVMEVVGNIHDNPELMKQNNEKEDNP